MFLIVGLNIDCGFSLELPHNEVALQSVHNLCFIANNKKMTLFSSENCRILQRYF